MKKVIVRNRTPEDLFPREFEEIHGEFNVRWNHPQSSKINKFSINDLEFIKLPPGENMNERLKFFEKFEGNKDIIPLDAFQGKTIFNDLSALKDLKRLWLKTWLKKQNPHDALNNVYFFGSTVFGDAGEFCHYPVIKFNSHCGVPVDFVCFDSGSYWSESDFALVFKKKFIEKLGI